MNETVYEFAREVYHMFPNWFWMGTALIGMIGLWLICVIYEHYEGNRQSNAIMMIDRDEKNDYRSRKTYYLCPECMKKIEQFLKEGGFCTSVNDKHCEKMKQDCVSDDVCEWHLDEYGRCHTRCNHLANNDTLEYTYCPYCGKKIKAV